MRNGRWPLESGCLAASAVSLFGPLSGGLVTLWSFVSMQELTGLLYSLLLDAVLVEVFNIESVLRPRNRRRCRPWHGL